MILKKLWKHEKNKIEFLAYLAYNNELKVEMRKDKLGFASIIDDSILCISREKMKIILLYI